MGRPETSLPGRRAFLQGGTLVLAAAVLDTVSPGSLFARDDTTQAGLLRIGLVTDLHYADKPAAGTRYYRQSLDKLAEAAERFRTNELAFVVELGDLIDAADTVAIEQSYLKRIDREFSATSSRRHYVLGNHCVFTLTKEEFLDGVGQPRSYYSFDRDDFHFIILDACFRTDGKPYGRKNSTWTDTDIPPAEVEWLRDDLKSTNKRTIVFVHQRLDVGNHYGVKSGPEVRRVLEESGKVLAVLQGHSHRNDYKEIAGIHYCTLVAMVEGSGVEDNGYSVMEIRPDGLIRVDGFRKQRDYEWAVGGGRTKGM